MISKIKISLIDGYGRYFDSEAEQVFSEKTKLLNGLVPHDALESGTTAVSEINRAYSERFPETGTVSSPQLRSRVLHFNVNTVKFGTTANRELIGSSLNRMSRTILVPNALRLMCFL